MFETYDKKTFWLSLFGILLMSILMKTTGGVGFAAIAIYALTVTLSGKTPQMLFTLILANCALMGNGWFFPKGFVFGVAHRAMLVIIGACLAVRMFGGGKQRVVAPLMMIFPFIMYMIIPSIEGWAPMVSLLKIFLFTMVFLAYAGSAKMALMSGDDNVYKYRAMVVATLAFFIFGSVALLPFPSIGFMGAADLANDAAFKADLEAGRILSLFKGMTWHSQSLGPLVSTFCLFLVGDMLFNIRRVDKLYLTMIAISPFLVYKTSSRTAMAVLICGILVMLFLFHSSRMIGQTWKSKVSGVSGVLGLLLILAIFALPSARQGVVNFALKYSQDEHAKFSTEEMLATRQTLMDVALYNWQKKPWIGNGFQVSEQMQYEKRRGLKDYLTAPVEKGVWITAILEEGGIIGFVLFTIFWVSAFFSLWVGRFYGTAAMLISFIVMNMAEFIILSMSGGGGFMWSLIFLMAILDGKRVQQENNFKMIGFR